MNEVERNLLAGIVDEETFGAFIRSLADERLQLERAGHHGDWEHGSIGTYLDAVAAAWEDGLRQDAGNPWQRAAQILLMGKYYE